MRRCLHRPGAAAQLAPSWPGLHFPCGPDRNPETFRLRNSQATGHKQGCSQVAKTVNKRPHRAAPEEQTHSCGQGMASEATTWAHAAVGPGLGRREPLSPVASIRLPL